MGSFQRVVQLPAAVDSDKAKASYKSGVLTIELPKVTEQITRKISVQRE
jgi:HSP20 family protein